MERGGAPGFCLQPFFIIKAGEEICSRVRVLLLEVYFLFAFKLCFAFPWFLVMVLSVKIF